MRHLIPSIPIAALLVAVLLAAAQANAARTALDSRFTLGGAYDSNVLLSGDGGDLIASVTPDLMLTVRGERVAGDIDYTGDLLWYGGRGARVLDHDLHLLGQVWGTPRLLVRWDARGRYASDELALARWGFLRPQSAAALGDGEFGITFRFTPTDELFAGVREDALVFVPEDGTSTIRLSPYNGWFKSLDPRDVLGVVGRAQLFMLASTSVIGTGLGLSAEWKRRVSEHVDLDLLLGPQMYDEGHHAFFLPRASAAIEIAWRESRGLHADLIHDLVIGANHAGALVGDIAEGGGFWWLTPSLRLSGRVGYYGNSSVSNPAEGWEAPAWLATGGARGRGAVEEAPALLATGGARRRGAMVDGYVVEARGEYALTHGFFFGVGATRVSGFGAAALERNLVNANVGWSSTRRR